MGNNYPWKRFLCPRTGGYTLDTEGYLSNPDQEPKYAKYIQPSLLTIEEASKAKCFVILGEPGIGKSRILSEVGASPKGANRNENAVSLHKNLNIYSTDAFLVQDVFNDQRMSEWKAGQHDLLLFLDSLDECLLRVDTVAQILVDQISRLPLERLYVRISCRTGVWPQVLESGLQTIFGMKELPVFEVVPLREVDVEAACKVEGVDPNAFLKAVTARDIAPFASRPVTLRFLLSTFKRNQGLPGDQMSLYRVGCQQLCEESNPSRTPGRAATTTAEVKVSVAARIAALTILTNRGTIWLGPDHEKSETDLTVSEIVGDSQAQEGHLQITNALVRETLDSGLFTSRGPNRMGWAHQTYAEFLASHYLVQYKFSPAQLKTLFFNPNPENQKIVPQLQQSAAFLAATSKAFFDILLQLDPEVLLRSDTTGLSEESREKVIQNVLTQVEQDKSLVHFASSDLRGRFSKLTHGNLKAQLGPLILDKSKSTSVRRLAVDIAEACLATGLADEIVRQALDSSDDYYLRINAAYAVNKFLGSSDKKRLLPLLQEDDKDPDDELKGYALSAAWPDHISAADLFLQLTPPKHEHFFGGYASFLYYDLVKKMPDAALPTALEWAAERVDKHESHSKFGQAIDRLVQHAWSRLPDERILKPFSKVVYSKLVDHQAIVEKGDSKEFSEKFSSAVDLRRSIFLSIFQQIPIADIDPYFCFSSSSVLLNTGDFGWLLEVISKESDKAKLEKLCQIVRWLGDWSNFTNIDAVLKLSKDNPLVREQMSWMIEPIELGSEQAKELKRRYERDKAFTEKKEEQVDLPDKLVGLVRQALDKFSSGDQISYWHLAWYLVADLKTGHVHDELQLIDGPVWNVLDDSTKAKVIEASKKYVQEFTPDVSAYFSANQVLHTVWSGLKALRLLAEIEPTYIDEQPSAFWKRWAAPLIVYPTFGSDDELRSLLLKKVFEFAQNEFESNLLRLVAKESDSDGHVFSVQKYRSNITESLKVKLLEVAGTVPPKPAISILRDLVKLQVNGAERLLSSFVSVPLPPKDAEKANILSAATTLMSESSDAGWPFLWPLFERDREFGRQVVLQASGGHESSFPRKLSVDHLKQFYLWMVAEFPHSDTRGGGWIGPTERAEQLRDATLKELVNRGSREACDAIRDLIRKLPKLGFLKWNLIEAENRNRWIEWVPPTPSQLLSLSRDVSKTLVRSEEDLQKAVVGSLSRFADLLHGTTPALPDLWNTEAGRYRPKEENEISDRIKRHLDHDLRDRGVIVNREVEIRRSVGPETGQRTDIQIDATVQRSNGGRDRISVILEVKGCWHSEVFQAAETQLANRYLKDCESRSGIYLVVDFCCAQWNPDGSRHSRAISNDVRSRFGEIETQAARLLDVGYSVVPVLLDATYRY